MSDHSGMQDLSVKEIMDRWPDTASAFIARRMHCVGCPMGPFHTLADAAMEHRLELCDLEESIQLAITASQAQVRHR